MTHSPVPWSALMSFAPGDRWLVVRDADGMLVGRLIGQADAALVIDAVNGQASLRADLEASVALCNRLADALASMVRAAYACEGPDCCIEEAEAALAQAGRPAR